MNDATIQTYRQFVNQSVTIHLSETEKAEAVQGKLLGVDPVGILLAESGTDTGCFLYPWQAIRYVQLSKDVNAFRVAA